MTLTPSGPPPIPWAAPDEWRAANAAVARLVRRPSGPLMSLAHQLEAALAETYPRLDALCRITCPHCPDPCCLSATVWLDFRDILQLHLTGQPIPPAQPRSRPGETCRYAGPSGCRLPRPQRPFICTWYLCPAQTAALRKRSGVASALVPGLERAKALRKDLESRLWRDHLSGDPSGVPMSRRDRGRGKLSPESA